MAVTETVKKFQEILSKFFPDRNEIKNIDLLVIQSEDKTKIMILKVPTSFVNDLKLVYKNVQDEVSKKFPGYLLFIIREEKVTTRSHEINLHEKWLVDLSYPALIQERTTDLSCDERTENVVLESSANLDEKLMRCREFIFKTLTERDVKFSLAPQ